MKAVGVILMIIVMHPAIVIGHEQSQHRFERSRRIAQADSAEKGEQPPATRNAEGCRLTIELVDGNTNLPLTGLVRITNANTGKHVMLTGEIKRDQNWFAIEPNATVDVPRTKLLVEAICGLETELATLRIDTSGRTTATARLVLRRFYDADEKGLKSGNTHLHLMKLTHAEAHRYLQVVPKADDLDLVFLSHLLRVPDDRDYISNVFVVNSFAGGDLKRLSQGGVLFSNGQEHRHNFGPYGEGYGHVMLLDILKLIEPVSIGPGIMQTGTDGIPLQRGIKTAHQDGATVIWCHNNFGLEDVPNWMAEVVDAQNIFDGGDHGSYDQTFYRYLNIGLKVPFSCGTDWFIYDFSRVYVLIEGALTSKQWLTQLSGGRTYITNGTFLEFQANNARIGDTIEMSAPGQLTLAARGIGRNDFRGLELVHNGKVVHETKARQADGHFESQMRYKLIAREPGWIALRIPLDVGNNEFGKQLFAHTSPIYVQVAGKHIFDKATATDLISEMKSNIDVIKAKGKFDGPGELESVLKVHRQGISMLQKRLQAAN